MPHLLSIGGTIRSHVFFAGKLLAVSILLLSEFHNHALASDPSNSEWLIASRQGDYDLAVSLSTEAIQNPLKTLIDQARALKLAQSSQWRAFVHYKPSVGGGWLSQVDAPHFFMSERGKHSPEAELDATLAAFFSDQAKPPLRLSAYCRFVARRVWLQEQLGELAAELPEVQCPEFERFTDYLQAEQLTLIFPTAHPNSPSSAFGHTLLRIDKKNQRPQSRLLNMSINFAAEVPEEVSSAAYAIKGLAGGFAGKFRLLPYHIKLREYGQIENRDTWEYPLKLDKQQVELVLRHAYEMLISHFDYFFFSENCSYHLLSLIEVAFPDQPLTENFGLWTIPVDTIRVLGDRKLVEQGQFVPSSIRTLKARRDQLPTTDQLLSLTGLDSGLESIANELDERDDRRQADILDLLSDYERYNRLKTNRSAQGNNQVERAILSRRSKLGIQSSTPDIPAPLSPPDRGHGTARLGLSYHYSRRGTDQVEINFRPAYHDFRDPSAAFGTTAAIELGLLGLAVETETDTAFLRRFTIVSIESIEPRDTFFKPVSWHTNLGWERATAQSRHEFTFNVGAGVAFQRNATLPVFFAFGESDLIDAPAYKQRRQLRLGASAGMHWQLSGKLRGGLELNVRQQIGGDHSHAIVEAWAGFALSENLSLNLDARQLKTRGLADGQQVSLGLRSYF